MDKIDLAAALKEIEHFLPKTNRFEIFKDGKLIFGVSMQVDQRPHDELYNLSPDDFRDKELKDFLRLTLQMLEAPSIPFDKSHFE
jgi:hypothetical protein